MKNSISSTTPRNFTSEIDQGVGSPLSSLGNAEDSVSEEIRIFSRQLNFELESQLRDERELAFTMFCLLCEVVFFPFYSSAGHSLSMDERKEYIISSLTLLFSSFLLEDNNYSFSVPASSVRLLRSLFLQFVCNDLPQAKNRLFQRLSGAHYPCPLLPPQLPHKIYEWESYNRLRQKLLLCGDYSSKRKGDVTGVESTLAIIGDTVSLFVLHTFRFLRVYFSHCEVLQGRHWVSNFPVISSTNSQLFPFFSVPSLWGRKSHPRGQKKERSSQSHKPWKTGRGRSSTACASFTSVFVLWERTCGLGPSRCWQPRTVNHGVSCPKSSPKNSPSKRQCDSIQPKLRQQDPIVPSFYFSTGCPRLDKALSPNGMSTFGGARAGFFTEVFGEAGSGKTQLLIQLLCTEATRVQVRRALYSALEAVCCGKDGQEDGEVREISPCKVHSLASLVNTTCSGSRTGLMAAALKEFVLWDSAFHQDTPPLECAAGCNDQRSENSTSSSRILAYLVAEEFPSSRMHEIASACLTSALQRYFDPFYVPPFISGAAHSYPSPLVRGVFPAAMVAAVESKVKRLVTTESILSDILIYRIRYGLDELAAVLAPTTINSQVEMNPSACILENLLLDSVGNSESDHCALGLLAVDSIAAVVQQSALSSETVIPSGTEKGREDQNDDEFYQCVTVKLRAIESSLHSLCRRYGVGVVVSNQVRSVCEGHELSKPPPEPALQRNDVMKSHCDYWSGLDSTSYLTVEYPEPRRIQEGWERCGASSLSFSKKSVITTALGFSWSQAPHVRIQLCRRQVPTPYTESNDFLLSAAKVERWLRVWSSPYSPRVADGSVLFSITSKGIEDVEGTQANISVR